MARGLRAAAADERGDQGRPAMRRVTALIRVTANVPGDATDSEAGGMLTGQLRRGLARTAALDLVAFSPPQVTG